MFVEFKDMLVKGLHAKGYTVLNNIVECAVFGIIEDGLALGMQTFDQHILESSYTVSSLLGQ